MEDDTGTKRRRCLSISTEKISHVISKVTALAAKCRELPDSPTLAQVVDLAAEVVRDVSDLGVSGAQDEGKALDATEIWDLIESAEPMYSVFPVAEASPEGILSAVGFGRVIGEGAPRPNLYMQDGLAVTVNYNSLGSGKIQHAGAGKVLLVRQSTLRRGKDGVDSDNVVWIYNRYGPDGSLVLDKSYQLVKRKMRRRDAA